MYKLKTLIIIHIHNIATTCSYILHAHTYCIMGYFHKVQIFMNPALLTLAEIFTIKKFLSSRNQHFTKIYKSFIVCIMQLATTCNCSLHYRVSQFTINSWAVGIMCTGCYNFHLSNVLVVSASSFLPVNSAMSLLATTGHRGSYILSMYVQIHNIHKEILEILFSLLLEEIST